MANKRTASSPQRPPEGNKSWRNANPSGGRVHSVRCDGPPSALAPNWWQGASALARPGLPPSTARRPTGVIMLDEVTKGQDDDKPIIRIEALRYLWLFWKGLAVVGAVPERALTAWRWRGTPSTDV
ncbi:hypothetical protein EDB89DRAFT_1908976 [Lactarius sanguifluus]|nr:hypothetical protein EDB89DRAFT_1908976 [Lactarius sanguifluus]